MNILLNPVDKVEVLTLQDNYIDLVAKDSNEVVQRAEGEVQRIVKDAEGYKEQKIALASGEAQRFLSVYTQYLKEKNVTKRRIYLETMKSIMAGMDKVLVENGKGGSGVVPYLPLEELARPKGGNSAAGGK